MFEVIFFLNNNVHYIALYCNICFKQHVRFILKYFDLFSENIYKNINKMALTQNTNIQIEIMTFLFCKFPY